MLRKDHYALIVKIKGIWHKSAINLNVAAHVEKLAIDGTSVLIRDTIDIMKWAM